jgi:peptidoglycan/LPS O-acetylase OafA/YrhL
MTDAKPVDSEKSGQPQTNFVGLDAVRGFAALAVVVLHALVPYLKHPMPGLVWSVKDSTSSVADGVFWSIELFVMPLFLVVAGFLTQQSWFRRGSVVGLIRTRARRLLRPLLFATIVILPIDLYIWVLGWIAEGMVSPIKLKSLKFEPSLSKDLWGLSHLWFLHYLFSYVVIFAGCKALARRYLDRRDAGSPLIQINLASCISVLWLLSVVVITFRPEVIWGFQHAFAPVASKWIYNGCFFAVGISLATFDPSAVKLKSLSSVLSVAAACILFLTVPLGVWSLDETSAVNRSSSVVLATMTASSSLLVSVMLISECLRRIRYLPRWVRYLAASSFWIYLVHHPVLALVHIDLKWLLPSMDPMFKSVIASLTAIAISLATYECFIRQTKLGKWLGMTWSTDHISVASGDSSIAGQRDSRPISLPMISDDQDLPIRRAA